MLAQYKPPIFAYEGAVQDLPDIGQSEAPTSPGLTDALNSAHASLDTDVATIGGRVVCTVLCAVFNVETTMLASVLSHACRKRALWFVGEEGGERI